MIQKLYYIKSTCYLMKNNCSFKISGIELKAIMKYECLALLDGIHEVLRVRLVQQKLTYR